MSGFNLFSRSTNGKTFSGSIYQRCNDRLETAVNLSWASGEASKDAKTNSTQFGIAAKYVLDKDASVRAKVDIESKIGLGYQQKLRDGNNFRESSELSTYFFLVSRNHFVIVNTNWC